VSDVELPAGALTTKSPSSAPGISRGRLARSGPLLGLTARTAAGAIVTGLRSKLTGADSTEFHVRTAERYTELLGNSKGALMKAGQMLSLTSAGSFVPLELASVYRAALSRLYETAPPMAPELAREMLERELGQPTASAFSEFDWEPFAAASIGQVHAARLHDGRAVAVKIQYPGVADAIAADLKNTELLATFLSLLFGGLSPRKMSADIRGMSRELAVRITEELDYRLEAANQAEFANHYRGHPFIHVPEVIGELCSDRVLTQELVLGRSWNDAVQASQELRDQWAEAIYRFTYGTYKRLRLFNADPHPGNYVFHDDGSVSFLDFGCVKRLQREQVTMVEAIAGACFRNDVLGTWRACVEAGLWRSSDPVTPEEAFAWWRHGNAMFGAGRRLITPVSAAKMVEHRYSPSGPAANALRYLTMPPEYTMLGRIEMAVSSVIGQLHARVYLGSLIAELFEGGTPITSMGKLDHEFFTEREGVAR
jgi:predicted unusual protein kinase regulating ubiquinone biosynthesis (AarF/ABC1/UbiB family)